MEFGDFECPDCGRAYHAVDILRQHFGNDLRLIIAAFVGFRGMAGAAANIAWILAVIGVILAVMFLVAGHRPPV